MRGHVRQAMDDPVLSPESSVRPRSIAAHSGRQHHGVAGPTALVSAAAWEESHPSARFWASTHPEEAHGGQRPVPRSAQPALQRCRRLLRGPKQQPHLPSTVRRPHRSLPGPSDPPCFEHPAPTVRSCHASPGRLRYPPRLHGRQCLAERIAETLRAAGLTADAVPVEQVYDLEGYDAVVLGGAAYMFHWLKDATKFAKRHHRELRSRPTWLFSSGPLGTDRVDEEGRDVLETTRPREFEELTALLHPRGERIFFGAWDPDAPPVGVGERMLRHMPAATQAMPAGDFRDWPAIEAWARDIATEITAATAS